MERIKHYNIACMQHIGRKLSHKTMEIGLQRNSVSLGVKFISSAMALV